jgi:hypothetical protein
MAAVSQSTVPWCTFLIAQRVRRGGAVVQPSDPSIRYAWLSARWAAAGRRDRAAYRAGSPAADIRKRRSRDRGRLQKLRSPFRTADLLDRGIIDPRDTRKLLVEFAGYAEKLRQPGESKFCMRP